MYEDYKHLHGRKPKKVVRNLLGYKRKKGFWYVLDKNLNVLEIERKKGEKYF